jgi:predicted metal-binding membrane protein
VSAGVAPLESVLRRDRAVVAACLALVTLLAWLYLAVLGGRMSRGDMRLMGTGGMPDMSGMDMGMGMGGAMTMAPMPWTGATLVLMLAMWWVMMLGMMLPSAAPMILLYARVHRRSAAGPNPLVPTALFASGYLLAWGAFSLAATLLQWGLAEAALLSPDAMRAGAPLGAALLVAAGAYQVTPLKRRCLVHCRAPVEFLARHWRGGRRGAVRMGVHHGLYCVGCCWMLMALLFVGGVMNLLWVAAIAGLVLAEKLLPRGEWIARAGGAAMIALGGVLLLRAAGAL